eukprot:TRINITY_DN8324_c0_g1_i1.p1 TRINITY_DN8324_c0_g1~~TRINITY_DN8324_c0_g1_i1.p1  ORF type:complete len:282 (+),score=59.39 TRINITY_DN8324_c0_g1_i1:36-848(+)
MKRRRSDGEDKGKKKAFLPKDEKIIEAERQKEKEERILQSISSTNTTAPTVPKTFFEKQNRKRVYVILENAPLETVKSGREFYLLNGDEHKNILAKNNLDPKDYRPDIVFQTLLTLFDSPLNKAGLLQVYVHTQKNVLIEINPHTRLPRTFNRFSGLMVQLLHKLVIRATSGSEKLLAVVKNPVTDHLPVGCRKIACEYQEDKPPVDLMKYITEKDMKDGPVAFVLGAMAHGSIKVDYAEESICFSNYPLSAAAACARLVSYFELLWGVV